MTKYNVLSAFSGCSMDRVALDRAGINVRWHMASEIDKPAIQVAKRNYPDIHHIGDVTECEHLWTERGYPEVDIMIGGSPCQGFSFAGKQLNFDDPRSKLFFEFVKLKNLLKPKYFLLENVRMKKQYQDIISEHLGVEPIAINSNLVSAQNRYRLYWTNIPNVTQPDDKGILLQDILEEGIVYKGGNLKSYFEKHRSQLVFSKDGLCHVGDADLKGHDSIKRVYHPQGKAPALTTMQGGHRETKVLCGAWGGRKKKMGCVQTLNKRLQGLTEQHP
jgi:Site-specific DNA methylase